MPTTVGLISDTHGLVRASAMHALNGVALILHAGDVGSRDVLIELGALAPVHAVFGNVDDAHTPGLEAHQWLTVEGWQVHVSHGHELRRPDPEALLHRYRDAGIIVFGHTHRALVHRAGGRLVINPGAAGPKRFDVVPSVARLTLSPGQADVEIIELT
ncbi:phosphoesterase [Luteitalea sp. TBR-22]|uniref:metallophosphoesterase family protein n=1 Tax=Luteitalea sp. TBR-22 TaxID=2802971 RepID=UPI001AF5F883|nr:metallophosphoesterase family protein [Luteitalea sp. TBR-22]BCS32817.1 phosphoesterase [Luteitalea sp. TBR-22]